MRGLGVALLHAVQDKCDFAHASRDTTHPPRKQPESGHFGTREPR